MQIKINVDINVPSGTKFLSTTNKDGLTSLCVKRQNIYYIRTIDLKAINPPPVNLHDVNTKDWFVFTSMAISL